MTAAVGTRRRGQHGDHPFSKVTCRKVIAAVHARALQGDPEAARFILEMAQRSSEPVSNQEHQHAEPHG